MNGILRQFDPDKRVLSKPMLFVIIPISEPFYSAVQWSLFTLDSDNKTLVAMGATNATAYQFNIYRDVKSIPETRQSPFPDSTFNPSDWYRIDNVTAVPIAVLGQHDWDGVDTDIYLTQAEPVGH
jgi:hypothetical protein